MIHYQPTDLIAQSPAWLYQDFEQRALQISQQLRQQHIHAVALWFEDAANLACTLLACWHAGVTTLFPPNDTPESVEWATQHSQMWLSDLDHPPMQAVRFSHFGADQIVSKKPENLPLVNRHSQAALWLKTSGSSGEAKTIKKTAEDLWLSAQVLADALPFPAGNHFSAVSSVSIQHIYGLTVHLMMSLANGWQIARRQQFFPACIVGECQQFPQTVLVSSPAMLGRMHWESVDIPNLAGVISSGGALPEDLSTQIRQTLQQPVVEIYGSTETGPIAVRQDVGLWQTLPESQIGIDEDGALWLEAKWAKERQQTADAVDITPDGFRLLGRIDRIVKVGDKRISLVAVEQTLNQHQWVEDCYIARHPDQDRLVGWTALSAQGIQVFREQGRKAVVAELKKALSAQQETAAIPRFWRFCDTLPRNSQSKISRLAFEQICRTPITDAIWQAVKTEEDLHILHGKVPLDLHYFKGHFAQFPLVPGVVELQWVSEKIAQQLGITRPMVRIDNLKFQKFLRPNDDFELRLKWEAHKNRVQFQLKTENENCASGLVVFADETL